MFDNLFAKKNNKTHVHHILAWPVIGLLALLVLIFVFDVNIEKDNYDNTLDLSVYIPRARAENLKNLRDFTSVDIMKLTKDVLTNQPSDADIASVVNALSKLNVKYIAIAVPMDASVDYPASNKPAPRTAEAFTQAWADAIHKAGIKVLWRGTWSGVEGIYNFKKLVGPARVDSSVWLNKTSAYITSHPIYFQDGDIWAPMPERTEGIFQDSTSFLPYVGGIQANYVNFFNSLKTTSDAAFAQINKAVITGWTANNFSEVKSGWMPASLYSSAGLISVDYYGTKHTPQEMRVDLTAVYQKTHRQIFLQEWSDYWDGNLSIAARQAYLDSMYAVFQQLANKGILAGFNYWGGWSNSVESILDKTPAGYQLNARGLQLADFFAKNK